MNVKTRGRRELKHNEKYGETSCMYQALTHTETTESKHQKKCCNTNANVLTAKKTTEVFEKEALS